MARTRYRRLSGGERQRLGLALALVGRPEVVVLDEPTAGMDPEARAATRAIVAGLRATGVAILLTSHDLADVERLADRVCILDRGRIVASGTPGELAAGAAAAPAVPARRAARRRTAWRASAGRSARPGRAPRSSAEPDAGYYRVDGVRAGRRAGRRARRLVRGADRLIVELRTPAARSRRATSSWSADAASR